MKKDIDKAKADAIDAQKLAKNAIYKAGELESHSVVLRDMLTCEKQEGQNIHKQTSSMSEQTRNIRKENADRETAAKVAAMASLTAAAEAAAAAAKAAQGNRGVKMGKLKSSPHGSDEDSASMQSDQTDSKRDGASSATSKDGKDGNGGKVEKVEKGGKGEEGGEGGKGGKGGKAGKGGKEKAGTKSAEISSARAPYLKEIGAAATKFIKSAPGTAPGSPKGKDGKSPGEPPGDHSEYELVRGQFEQNTSDGKDTSLAAMDELQYGSPRPKRNARDEAKQPAAEFEALKKASSPEALKQNLKIPKDDQILQPHRYGIDFQDSKTNVRITSPDKSPDASAKRKAEDDVRKLREQEEARRRALEDEARRKREEENMKMKAATHAKKKEDDRSAAGSVAKASTAQLDSKKKQKQEEQAAAALAAAAAKRAKDDAAAAEAAALASGSGKGGKEFIDDKMQGVIKKNIIEVLGHLDIVTESVQQKATASGTAKSSAEDVLHKLDKPK